MAVRVVLAIVYSGPALSPDSASYRGMSAHLFGLSSRNYLGIRTPVYPFVIRVLGSHPDTVWALQSVLGVLSCLLVYGTVLRLTGRPGVALGTGVVMTLSMNVLFFEAEILTESIVLFLLTASMFTFTLLFNTARRGLWGLVLGLLTGIAALTRPESALLIVVWPVAYFVARGASVRHTVRGSRFALIASMTVPGLVAVAAWSGVNASVVGQFTPTTLTGLNLVDHLGASVSSAPDRDAQIRDIYVQARNRSIAEGHGDANVSYTAMPAMEKVTGKSFAGVSRELTSMSLNVITHHPQDYLEIAVKSWVRSWDAPIYWQPSRLHPTVVRSVTKGLWHAERPLLITINGGFLLLSLASLTRRFRRNPSASRRLAMTLMGVVLVMSLPQAFLANGENGRYLFPYYPMILVTLAVGVDGLLTRNGGATTQLDMPPHR